MANPTCLWCGEETARFKDTVAFFECETEGCVAAGNPMKQEMLEQYPVPCEIQVWEVEYSFPLEEESEPRQATWLGLFATEELAMEAGEKAFGIMANAGKAFDWDASPVVFTFKGGV